MKFRLNVSGYYIMLQIWSIELQTFKSEPNIIFPFNKKKREKKNSELGIQIFFIN